MDRIGENDLYFGLWSSDYKDILSPVEKKQIYDVFRFIDVSRQSHTSSPDLTSFALPLIGADSWEELIPTLAPETIPKKHFFESISQSPDDSGLRQTVIYDFSGGNLYSFFPSDSVRYLEILPHDRYRNVLNAVLYPTDAVEYAGIASYANHAISIEDETYLRLCLAATHGESDEASSILVRLSGTGKDGMPCIFEGAATVQAGDYTTLTFSIEEYAKSVAEIDSIRIWVKGHAGTVSGDCTLSIASISLLHPSHFSLHSLLITVLAVLCALAVVILILYFVVHFLAKRRKKRMQQMHRVKGHHRYHLDAKQGEETKKPQDNKKG